MINKYPNEFIMNTEKASCISQDIITMGAGLIYWNRIFIVEFLDDYLRIKDNINIFYKKICSPSLLLLE